MMAWTNPTLRTTGDVISVAIWNTDVVENLSFLGSQHDHNGDDGDGGLPGLSVPSGLIAIFETSCPSGWTWVSVFNGRLIKASPNYGATGGTSSEHTHTMNLSDYTSMEPEYLPGYDGSYPEYDKTYWAAMGSEEGYYNEPLYMFPYSSGDGGSLYNRAYFAYTDDPSTPKNGISGTWEPYPSYIDVVFCKKD